MATGDVQVLLSHPMARSHPCAGSSTREQRQQRAPTEKRGSCFQARGGSGNAAPTMLRQSPQAHTNATSAAQPHPAGWLDTEGKQKKYHKVKQHHCPGQSLFLSPSTIVAALMQIISEQEDQRFSVNQLSPVFIFLPAPKASPGFNTINLRHSAPCPQPLPIHTGLGRCLLIWQRR